MEYILSSIIIIIESFSLKNFAETFLSKKASSHNNVFFAFLGYICCTFLFSNFLLNNNSIYKYIFSISIFFVFISFLFIGKTYVKLFIAVIFFIIIYGADFIIISLLTYIFNITLNDLFTVPVFYIITATLSKFILYFITYSLRHFSKHNKVGHNFNKKQFFNAFIFPVFSLITILILFDLTVTYHITSIWIAIDIVGIIIANIIVISILEKIEYDNLMEQNNIILQQQLKSELDNINNITQLYSQQRKLTHDFNNHLHIINSLINNSDITNLQQYVDDLLLLSDRYPLVIYSKNNVIDAILNQKYSKALSVGISINFEVSDLSDLTIPIKDIVIILGNAIDNAIEASAKTSEKQINIKIVKDDWKTLISIKNTSPPVDIKDNTIVTSKSDTISHGYGLSNIKTVLLPYDHIFALTYNEGWFQLTIVFNK